MYQEYHFEILQINQHDKKQRYYLRTMVGALRIFMSPVAYIADPYLFKFAVYILTFLYLQDILYIFIYIVASLSRHLKSWS